MEYGDFSEMWSEGAKKALELYLEGSERMARVALEFHERSTTWARDTMLGPLFEAQRLAGRQMLDSSVEVTRKLIGIDQRTANKAQAKP